MKFVMSWDARKKKLQNQARWALQPALNNWSKIESSVKKMSNTKNLLSDYEQANDFLNKYFETFKEPLRNKGKEIEA